MPDCNSKYYEELFEKNKSLVRKIFSRLFSKSKVIPSFCSMCRLTITDEQSRAEHRISCMKLHIVLFTRLAATSRINQLKLLPDPEANNKISFYLNTKAKLEKILDEEGSKWQRKYNISLHQSLRIKLESFEFIKPLTKGGYGQIFLLKDKITGKEMAAKIISISEAIQRSCIDSYVTERELLLKCKSEFIVSLFYSFRSEFFIYQIMEYIPNGDLSAYLEIISCFSEDAVRAVIAQLLLALKELKTRKIVHGDIKLENLLYSADSGLIKLADFGLSFDLGSPNKSSLGTPEYMAPEQIVKSKKGFESDMWAVGVCAYEMLCGTPPFYSESANETLQKVSKYERLQWNAQEISSTAKDLIERLLCSDPITRLSLEEAMKHEFFTDVNWSILPKVELPNLNHVFEERNKRFGPFKYYNMNTISTEIVAFEEGVFNQHTNTRNQADLLKIFPIKNLNKLK